MAERIGYLDGGPDARHLAFVDPAGVIRVQVDAQTCRDTGHRFANCATCGWNVHGPDRGGVDGQMDVHFEEHLAEMGLK
ncbi:hypothetical protein [Mycolicibacterium aubagnense]|uniref:Uncharacterized protein n=1 Tax=Mycolicibacterium aubagnense TaxID=319707 RepID=A0ABM7IMB8_9MYCO|nr:hypothetical protein [Mycolicibacterium aubagnense]TLH64253.1 hypothetical protein C1S80_12635 [Mycolicibacterium aubagnense]BBX87894.1 hypothetical protein MAUB_57670 [Mycolicibacterium aubagnense]